MTLGSVVFKPLSTASFRWGGEFSPQVRGPQAYARSHPLPLPSTVAGALAGLSLALTGVDLCPRSSSEPQDVYENVRFGLEKLFGSEVILRGPYLYASSDTGYVLCFPFRAGRMLCLSSDLEVKSVRYGLSSHIGIALDSTKKIVVEGMIYTLIYHDVNATIENVAREFNMKIREYGVLVEVHRRPGGESVDIETLSAKIDSSLVVLGSEQRPFRVRFVKRAPMYDILSRMSVDAEECFYWHIATPILIEADIKIDGPLSTVAQDLYKSLVGLAGLRECERRSLEKIVFTSTSSGYDMCSNKRRPHHPAVLPGSGFYGSTRQPTSVYLNGVGRYSQLGWGTIVPIKREYIESLMRDER